MRFIPDWPAYFKEFSRVHGGNPLVYRANPETGKGGYLLFQDGWMYAREHPSGPEHPPLNPIDGYQSPSTTGY